MNEVWKKATSFAQSEEGASLTEYAIMLALIVLACVVIVHSTGYRVDGVFTTLDSALPTDPGI